MKIPSNLDLQKPRIREQRNGSSTHYLREMDDLYSSKIPRRQNKKDSLEPPVFKRDIKTSLQERKPGIRKRSIKPSEKKEQDSSVIRKIEENYNKLTISSPIQRRLKHINKEHHHPVLKINQKKASSPLADLRRSESIVNPDELQYLSRGINFKRKSMVEEEQSPKKVNK